MRLGLVLVCGLMVLASGARAQSQASQLHDALHLSQAQEDGWRSFQAAIAPDPQQQARAQQTAALIPTLPTPRRLALIRAQMQADQTTFDRNANAVISYYETLTPQQKTIFDKQTAPSQQSRR